MASTSPRTNCSGLHRSSCSVAPSTSGFSRRSTAFGSPSPVTPFKLQGQSFQSARPQNSPGHSISVKNGAKNGASSSQTKSCMCSPSTHAGAFLCSLHRLAKKSGDDQQLRDQPSFHRSSDVSLVLRRLSLANSLLKIGVSEGRNLLRKASSPPQPKVELRGAVFQRRPSPLSRMSKADDR